jgi:hypothetical protein
MALGMISLGIEILLVPDVALAPSFRLLSLTTPKLAIDLFLIFFGVLRIAALISNGRSTVHGPRLRAIGAIAGALLWAQFDISIAYSVLIDAATPPAATAFWFSFIFGELYSAYRAAGDVQHSPQA